LAHMPNRPFAPPSRRGPVSPRAARSDTRSPRFRPAPFVRDGVMDHDGFRQHLRQQV
jgi:hypothetical protein